MVKFREIAVGDVVWFCCRLSNGRTLYLYPSHWKGECSRPGKRMT